MKTADVQEAERMNVLLGAMRRSLAELDLGLKGDLTMSEPMEKLMYSLASDQVPAGIAISFHLAKPFSLPIATLTLAKVLNATVCQTSYHLIVSNDVCLPG